MPLRLDPSRTAAWTAMLLLAAGLFVASYACWAIVDWHRAASASPPAGLERIQYDTAWAFAFAGAALIAHATGFDRVGSLCAGVPIVLGALRIIAYIAPGAMRIHPILANPALPYGAGNYNDMGVLTALVFVVMGSGLGSLRAVMRGPWRSVLIAMLASVALALALLLLFGAWTGGTAASGLLLTGGDRTNALLFLVLGSAVLGYALLGSEEEQHQLRRWTPAIVWFAVFVCALVLWRALSTQEARYIQNSTRLVASDIRGQIERELAAHMQLLQRLADRSQIYGFTEEQWQQDAGALLRDVPEFQALAWAGEDLAIRWVAPLPRPDSPVYDLRADPGQRLGIDSMVTTRRPAVTRFVNLAGGKKGFAILVPEYVGDSLRGRVVAALGSGHWLESLLAHRVPEYEVSLLEDGGLIDAASADASPAAAEWAQEQTLVVANAQWTLRVMPKRATMQQAASPLPELSLALGTLLATLLALCVYLFQTARQHARDLAVTNAQLVDDVQARRLAEQALRESEYRTRLIIDAIKDRAIYMLDTEGRVASWNPGAEALNGYTAAEILGQHFSILYPPERKQPFESELEIAARQGWYEEDCWHQRKDGTRYCGDDSI